MTVKEQLREARRMKAAILGKQERLEELRAIAESTTTFINGMPAGGKTQDRLGATVALIVDFSQELADETAQMLLKQADLKKAINQLSKPEYRTALELYYFNAWTWEKVAKEMCYSVRRVKDFHEISIKEMERNMFAPYCT